MEIIESEELNELANYFPDGRELYAVGGCVRDAIRGEKCYDIDLSGAVLPEELTAILQGTQFKVTSASARLGTVIIKGKEAYEYTTFRIDSYPTGSGVHTPSEVEFTQDLSTDAKRRDFKCNAIYYEIKSKKIIDPLNGISDVRNKILSTTVDPDTVLSQDGLRILRLVRFVSTLGYDVEQNTYDSAKRLVSRLEEISVERVRDELDKILGGQYCYKALTMMRDLGILKIILPELAENDGVAQKPQYHKYDVLEHIFKTVEACPVSARLAALFHDIAKSVCQKNDGNMYLHNKVGAEMTRDVMTRLKYPNKQIERTIKMVEAHMYDGNCSAKEFKCRKFIAEHIDVFDDLTALMEADCIAKGYCEKSLTAEKLRGIHARMIQQNVPMSIKEMNVSGTDLQNLGFRGKAIGDTLEELWLEILRGRLCNEKTALIKYAKSIIGRA